MRTGHQELNETVHNTEARPSGRLQAFVTFPNATVSVGALESTIQSEVEIEDFADLGAAWEKLGAIDAHRQWSKDIEPYIVSGTPHWQIFRVL